MAGGRIRSLKPELLEDELVACLSSDAFRLFVACILLADDYGNLRFTPRYLAGQVFWAHPEVDIEASCAELSRLRTSGEAGLLTVYSVRGQLYAHLTGWEKHQRVDKPGHPRVPPTSDADPPRTEPRESPANIREAPAKPREDLAPDLDLDPTGTPIRIWTPSGSPIARARDVVVRRLEPSPEHGADPPPADMGPEAIKLLAELRSHPALAAVATHDVAEMLEGRRMARGADIEHVREAIRTLAADAVRGWTEEIIRRKLRAYCDRAGPDLRGPPRLALVGAASGRQPRSSAWTEQSGDWDGT